MRLPRFPVVGAGEWPRSSIVGFRKSFLQKVKSMVACGENGSGREGGRGPGGRGSRCKDPVRELSLPGELQVIPLVGVKDVTGMGAKLFRRESNEKPMLRF